LAEVFDAANHLPSSTFAGIWEGCRVRPAQAVPGAAAALAVVAAGDAMDRVEGCLFHRGGAGSGADPGHVPLRRYDDRRPDAGTSRSAAARFSFLLSIPVIMLADALQLHELGISGGAVDWKALVIGCVTSGIAAYLCIHVFLKLLERIGMLPFIIYRLLLGGILVYSGA
jgi:hypothetical protein